MSRERKIQIVAIGMLCLATLSTGACVTRGTYDTAAADLAAMKAELRSTRTYSQGLTQLVNDLQQRQIDLARERELALSALQQTTKEVKANRNASQKRLRDLNGTIKHLTAQHKSLQDGFNRGTKQRASLQSALDGYRSKYGSVDELRASSPPPQPAAGNEPGRTALVTQAQSPVPTEPAPKPTLTSTVAPINQTAANPTPPPAVVQPPEPVEEDWLTFLKNWIASLWQSVVFS